MPGTMRLRTSPVRPLVKLRPLFSELVPQVGEKGHALGHYNVAAVWWASWESEVDKSSQPWGFGSDGH